MLNEDIFSVVEILMPCDEVSGFLSVTPLASDRHFEIGQRDDKKRKKIAIVATAHYLVQVMWSMMKNKTKWNETVQETEGKVHGMKALSTSPTKATLHTRVDEHKKQKIRELIEVECRRSCFILRLRVGF